jgi:hypothetical protein
MSITAIILLKYLQGVVDDHQPQVHVVVLAAREVAHLADGATALYIGTKASTM